MADRRVLILFTRLPIAGITKTRLQTALSPEQCADLHRAFLQDIALALTSVDADVSVFYGADVPPGDHSVEHALDFLRTTFGKRVRYVSQSGGDFGARLRDAYRTMWKAGYRRILFLGSDWVEIDPVEISTTYEILGKFDCVLKPAADGGYCLLALAGWHPEVLSIPDFGKHLTLAETVGCLVEAGLSYHILSLGHDIDVPMDLGGLYGRLALAERVCAPHTWQWLQNHRGLVVR